MRIPKSVVVLLFAAQLIAAEPPVGSPASQPSGTLAAPIPTSLANFYPPNSPAPTFLLAMLELGNSLSGIVSEVMTHDIAGAQGCFDAFSKAYAEAAAMVPEWAAHYPSAPMEKLKAALAIGDPGQVMPAVEEIGKSCHGCHIATMAPVQQRFRWGRFADITVTDPLSQQTVPLAQFMMMMQGNFSAVEVDLRQGQVDNARRQAAGFGARFEAMKGACMNCHDTERHYYVDSRMTDQVTALQKTLGNEPLDAGAVGGILREIGQESCDKCHLVHIPAAYAQRHVSDNQH